MNIPNKYCGLGPVLLNDRFWLFGSGIGIGGLDLGLFGREDFGSLDFFSDNTE